MSSGRKWVEPGWGKLVTRAMPLNSTSSPGYQFLLLPSLSIVSLPPPLASFHVALTPSLLPPYAPATVRFASPPAQKHRVNWYRVDTSDNVSQNIHFLVYTRCLDTWTSNKYLTSAFASWEPGCVWSFTNITVFNVCLKKRKMEKTWLQPTFNLSRKIIDLHNCCVASS